MKSAKSSRYSPPNSKESPAKPCHENVLTSVDSCSIPTKKSQSNNMTESEVSSKATSKPLSKVAKATSRLSFFKTRMKQNNDDLFEVVSSSLKKNDQPKKSGEAVILQRTEERFSSVSRLSGIIKPRKLRETFKVTRSAKESVLRPSSDSSCHDKTSATIFRKSSGDSVSKCRSSPISNETFSQKLKYGMSLSKSKSYQMNEKRVERDLSLPLRKQENFISSSVDCVPWRLEKNRTFLKEDFEAAALPASSNNIPETLNREPHLFRTYSEDCCERTFLENSPSLSSRASSFGILNDSYLLEQTFGGESVKGEAFEGDLTFGTQGSTRRQRHNTFVIRDNSKDKVLSLSSLMMSSPQKNISKHDSKQKTLSCTFVVGKTSKYLNTIDGMTDHVLLEKLEAVVPRNITAEHESVLRSGDFSAEESKRPMSIFSTCSTDAGIIADCAVDGADQHLVNKDMRPVSIISTSSIDTGYQPDSDVENCRIATTNNDSNNSTFPGSLNASPSSSLSKSSGETLSDMTDSNNNNSNDFTITTTTINTTATPSNATFTRIETSCIEGVDNDDDNKNDDDDDDNNVAKPRTELPDNNLTCTTSDVQTIESITTSQSLLFSNDDDDDDEDDDYLILSNGATLLGSLAGDGIHRMTSTPEKKGQMIITSKRDFPMEGFGCRTFKPSIIDDDDDESICCQIKKMTSLEDLTNSDFYLTTSDDDKGKLFTSHPMELSCIVEADNETSLPVEEGYHGRVSDDLKVEEGLHGKVSDDLKVEEGLHGKVSDDLKVDLDPEDPQSNVAADDHQSRSKGDLAFDHKQSLKHIAQDAATTNVTLMHSLEEIDSKDVLKMAFPSSEVSSLPGASSQHDSVKHNKSNHSTNTTTQENKSMTCLEDDGGHCEVTESGTPVDPSSSDSNTEVKESVALHHTSSVEHPVVTTRTISKPDCFPNQETTTTDAASFPEVFQLEDIGVGGKIGPPSLMIKSEEIGDTLIGDKRTTGSKESISPGNNKSPPERNNPLKNIGKSKKSLDPIPTTKSPTAKTTVKPEKPQKSSFSTSPKNVSRAPQTSSIGSQSKSKLSEPSLKKNPLTSRYQSPRLQTNLIGSSGKASSMIVSLNHLVDGQKIIQNARQVSSNSSSPKMKDKMLSLAGSDGKLENMALQGKKIPPKNLFQSSSDLKSKPSGEALITMKSTFKKPLPIKRNSVAQEPSKTTTTVRRASMNASSSLKQKTASILNASNSSNPASTSNPLPVKKPIIPPKPSTSRNNNSTKHPVTTSNKTSLDKSSNGNGCHDDRIVSVKIRQEEAQTKRDLQVGRLKTELWKTTRAFEALSVVVVYFEAKVEKKHQGLMSTTKKLHQASSTLASFKEQLNIATRQRDSLLMELQTTEERHRREINDLKDSMNAERVMMEKEASNRLEAEVNKVNKQHAETMSSSKSTHKKELEQLSDCHKNELKDKDDEKIEEMKVIDEQHERKMRNVSSEHKHQLEDVAYRFEQMKMTLLEKVDMLRSECDDLRCRESSFMESCQREAEIQIQSCLTRYKQLPQEIESLKAVLELRNQEVHELRSSNLERQKEHEELEESRRMIHFLKQKIENLEAIVDMRGDYEKQLTEKHQLLLRKLERESKVNKRLSMDNEELQWKLSSVAQLPGLNYPFSDQQFPSDMSSSFTSGVTSLDRKFGKSLPSDRRPLSVGETTKQKSTPASSTDVTNPATRRCEVFDGPSEPSTPSFLSFSPPRHSGVRSARASSKACSKNIATTTAGSTVIHSRTPSFSSKISSVVCGSGDGNKLQRSGTYSLKDLERDVV